MPQSPRFLIQAHGGWLFAYNRLDVLLCDLSANRGLEKPQIFIARATDRIGVEAWAPITEAELRDLAAIEDRRPHGA